MDFIGEPAVCSSALPSISLLSSSCTWFRPADSMDFLAYWCSSGMRLFFSKFVRDCYSLLHVFMNITVLVFGMISRNWILNYELAYLPFKKMFTRLKIMKVL